MKEKIELYRMRTFTELLSDTFSFVRQNFKPLFKGLFFIASPAMLLSAIAGFFFWKNYFAIFMNEMVERSGSPIANMFFPMILMYLCMIISITLVMAVTYSYIKFYREDKEREITVSMLWQESKKHFWKIIGTLMLILVALIVIMLLFTFLGGIVSGGNAGLTVLFIFLMMIIFLVLGVFFSVKFAFFPFFIVLSDSSVINSISASYNFTRGIFWKTFGFIFVLGMIVGFASGIFMVPGYLFMVIGLITGITHTGSTSFILLLSNALISVGMACAFMLYSVIFTGNSIFYFSEIEKKDGVMANREIDEIGKCEE